MYVTPILSWPGRVLVLFTRLVRVIGMAWGRQILDKSSVYRTRPDRKEGLVCTVLDLIVTHRQIQYLTDFHVGCNESGA